MIPPNFYQCEMLGKFTSPSINLKLIGFKVPRSGVLTKISVTAENFRNSFMIPILKISVFVIQHEETDFSCCCFITPIAFVRNPSQPWQKVSDAVKTPGTCEEGSCNFFKSLGNSFWGQLNNTKLFCLEGESNLMLKSMVDLGWFCPQNRWWLKSCTSWAWQFIPLFTRFYTSQLVQDFSHKP